jgi:hypothetical protein
VALQPAHGSGNDAFASLLPAKLRLDMDGGLQALRVSVGPSHILPLRDVLHAVTRCVPPLSSFGPFAHPAAGASASAGSGSGGPAFYPAATYLHLARKVVSVAVKLSVRDLEVGATHTATATATATPS